MDNSGLYDVAFNLSKAANYQVFLWEAVLSVLAMAGFKGSLDHLMVIFVCFNQKSQNRHNKTAFGVM